MTPRRRTDRPTGDTTAAPTLRDGTEVAAWMFKANPEVWDVLDFLATGSAVDAWRMTPSYRVALVRPGHRCVLWVTGAATAAHVAGVWAIGTVTGEPYEDVGDPGDPRWIDHEARSHPRPYVETSMAPLPHPVPRDDLRADPRFADAEILTRPRMGSPLALTARQLAAVLDLAPIGFGPPARAE